MELKGKRRAFADAVLLGKSNKDAAIAAGCSVKTASAAGSRLAKDPAVVAYIKQRCGDLVPPAAAALTPDAQAPAGAPAAQEPAAASASAAKPFDVHAAIMHADPKDFLMVAMNDGQLDPKQRIVAARALMPFIHGKMADAGKKDAKAAAAKAAGTSRFGAGAPPKLVVSNK